jgi:hypothetical protein
LDEPTTGSSGPRRDAFEGLRPVTVPNCANRSPRYPRPIRLLFDYGLSQMRWICAGELLIGLTSPFRKSLASRTLPEREDTVLRKMF